MTAAPGPDADEKDEQPLIAYCVDPRLRVPIVPAPRGREWMDRTPQRFAYRCLPMLMANQSGWLLLSPHRVSVRWNGGVGRDALRIRHLSGSEPYSASSDFGSGILSWVLPYVFRTSPGYNLLVRGPANMPKDGIQPLEGLVETDWGEIAFTMNWQMTRANHTVFFEEGEPIAMIVPQRRNETERFRPAIRDLASDPKLHAAVYQQAVTRAAFNAGAGGAQVWQRDYFRGVAVGEAMPREHQTKRDLAPFVDERKS